MNHFSISYPRRQNLEMIHHKKLVTIEDYELYIGTEAVDQILQKAKRFKDLANRGTLYLITFDNLN